MVLNNKIFLLYELTSIFYVNYVSKFSSVLSTNMLLFAAVLRIAANYCFHGSSLLTAVTETQV